MVRAKVVLVVAVFLATAVSLPPLRGETAGLTTSPAVSNCAGPRPLPPTLYVADLSESKGFSTDEQLLFVALQGIVNRSSPQIYLEGLVTDTTSGTWLSDGVVPIPIRDTAPYDLLATFRPAVKGLVVWDPGLAVDTQNVATTIAGVDDLLPVSPALARRLSAPPYDLPVRIDLRDRHFTSRAAAYGWALSRFGRNTKVLGWLGGDRHGLRDLLVACRGFVFEASPETDAALVLRTLNAYPAQTPVFGYPCLDDPLSRRTGVPVCEPAGVGEISGSGKFLIPTDLAVNLTVHSAFRPTMQRPGWDDHVEIPDSSKTYVTFIISDGDNLGYNEEFLRSHQWIEAGRGSIPMGISISPWLGVYAPRLYSYYVRTLTGDDVLVSGPSGAGYVYPGFDPDLSTYLRRTGALLGLDGLKAVWILDNGYAYSPTPAVVRDYVQTLRPSGLFSDYFGWITPNLPAESFDGNVPVSHAIWGSCVANTIDRIQLSAMTYPTRPAFVFVALDTWQMGFDEAKQVMAWLGTGYVAVRPDRFIGLLKGSRLAAGSPRPSVRPPASPGLVPPACIP